MPSKLLVLVKLDERAHDCGPLVLTEFDSRVFMTELTLIIGKFEGQIPPDNQKFSVRPGFVGKVCMKKNSTVLIKLSIVLLTIFCQLSLFAQVSAKQKNTTDSLLAIQYRDQSEICEIADIPRYVELILKTVQPHISGHSLNDTTTKFYLAIEATALNNLGFYFEHNGKADFSKKFLHGAAFLQQQINDKKALAVTLSNIGSVYETTGDVKQAINLYYQSLSIREQINDKAGIANVTHNLANLFHSVGNINEAYNFSLRGLKIRRQLKDSSGVAFSYENIAVILAERGDTLQAIKYFNFAADQFLRLNEKEYRTSSEVSRGIALQLQKNCVEAKVHFQKALAAYLDQKQFIQTASLFNRMADAEGRLGNISSAISYALKAKQIAKETNNILALTGACKRLSDFYERSSQSQLAYQNFQEFHTLSDSVKNTSNRNLMVVEDITHEYDKKAIQDSIKLGNDRKEFEVKLEENRSKLTYGIILVIILGFSAGFAFLRYRQSARQSKIIALQKIEVEKQKSLADSRLEISEAQKKVIQSSLYTLEKTQESLLLAKIEAEKSSKAKSEFISHVSHEIRTPLNAILGFAELMKDKELQNTSLKYLDHILQSGNNLLSMVNELLDYSKIEAGHLQLRNVETNLCELLKDCANMFQQTARQKNLEFESQCQAGFPELCLIDALRVRQIIYNLLGNAIKFTAQGKVAIALSYAFDQDVTNKISVFIRVSDTGKGIEEDQQELIFDAFKQHEGQDTQKYGGSGLGLAITKKIVQALNGEISLESKIGYGSSFTVSIHGVEIIEKPGIEADRLLNGKTIVLIEQIEESIFSAYAKSNRKRIHIISMADYNEAMQVLEKITPDLFVVALSHNAINLKNQVELYNRARTKKIPVLFLSDKKENTTASLLGKAFDLQWTWPQQAPEIEAAFLSALSIKAQIETEPARSIVRADEIQPELLLLEWEKISEHKSCDDISRFATVLWQLAREHHLTHLFVYADQLLNALEQYNVNEIYAVFADFKAVLDKQLEGVH
eukprot:gene4008-5735_t